MVPLSSPSSVSSEIRRLSKKGLAQGRQMLPATRWALAAAAAGVSPAPMKALVRLVTLPRAPPQAAPLVPRLS
ncbi:hypothetical protein D3C80_1532450 [compost metagenome]